MERQEVLNQISSTMGRVPDWLGNLPDPVLEHMWGMASWFLSDTRLSSQEKALIGFGAASAAHCPY